MHDETTPATRSWPVQLAGLLGFVLICFLAASLGGLLTASSVRGWYQQLNKPALAPPDWVFGPVWTILYLMMAVAAWLVWRRGRWTEQRKPLVLFAIQLALNVAWSGIFFAMQNPGLAFAEILVLWLAILGTAISFWYRSRLAAGLLVPYLAWVTFAAFLNFEFWRLND